MPYVPSTPGVPPPMSFGQGYGNWQQYGGFDATTNPYGGGQGFGVQPSDQVKKSSVDAVKVPEFDTNVEKPDYSITSAVPPGQFGAAPNSSFGLKPNSSFGAVQQSAPDPYNVINSHYGVTQ